MRRRGDGPFRGMSATDACAARSSADGDGRRVRDRQALVGRVDEAAGAESPSPSRGRASRPASSVTSWPAAGPDRPAPETGGRAGPRSRRWPRRARPSAAGGSSTSPARQLHLRQLLRRDADLHARGWSTRAARASPADARRRAGAVAVAQQPLLHQLPRAHQVGALLEDQHDRRQAEHRFRAQRLEPGTPFSAFSSGTVTRLSTSSVERPGASVWISTSGGANSGNTSSGVLQPRAVPATISTTASATMTNEAGATIRRAGASCPVYLPMPNSMPNSSAAPSVTTRAPTAGPRARIAVAPLMSFTDTRCRTYCCGARTT